MIRPSPRGVSALAALTWLLCVAPAEAQVTTADVVGRVTDSSGGALPGATVTITNPATGDTRTLVTSESGDYTFNLLPIGKYALTVELQGFAPFAGTLQLSAGDRRRMDPQLVVG